jgi:site-specific DNA-methyltransferase (adenine-specific)
MNIDLSKKLNLIQGDCLEILKQLPDKSIDLILTDPPYNIGKDIKNDNLCLNEFKIFTTTYLLELKRIIKDKKPILIFFNTGESLADFINISSTILKFKKYINWYKPNDCSFPIGTVLRKSEALLLFSAEGSLNYKSDKNIHDCLIYNKIIKDRTFWHPTVKELPLMEELVLAFSKKNDLILDCFMGSGTTGVASLKLQRKFIGIELDNNFFEICKTRINQQATQQFLGGF